jgi:DNA-binding NarL/FixJ family response regulator
VRIFIASRDSNFRMALQMLLESEPGMVVIGMSDRVEGLCTMMGASQPEVLLLDYELNQQTTNQIISDIHGLKCQCKIIVFSIDPQVREPTLAAGADGFINKNFPPDRLLPILRDMRLSATTS